MSEDLLQTALDDDTAEAPAETPSSGRPSYVPEKFWDPVLGELRVDALLKSYRELERRLSQRFQPPGDDAPEEERLRFRRALGVPDAPEDYGIEAKHPLAGPCPVVNARLHEAGFTPPQAQLVYDLAAERMGPLIAEATAQFEAERQLDRLRAHFGGDDRFRRIAAQMAAWGRASLPAPVFQALSTTYEGVVALHQMMGSDEPAMPRSTEAPAAADEAELRAMMRDPRYWRAREPAFVNRVTEGFRRLVGG
ncbi:hypothetical protein M0638_08050 [Roseomonas sp. NAR14]|uniref:Uncharacterized protein n=1 Tax=Roseomonas acroporae TaxID=2937791 RepID=A0A9X1Y723_9PROT|nr:hypothetical protein [Roseomonas acroporae]MCK8784328.1 hypothetical protein [Roseomonas acroporae]